jgi:RNA polymerase-interacting CarD/CdnL/TRCF family regulator
MYKINDVVMYKRDVCRVVGKEKSGFTGEKCYILVPYNSTDGSTRMQVPVSNKAGHLRDLITKEEIIELINETPDIEMLENKSANMKSQYANLLKTDKISDLVCIIKTSYERNRLRMEQHKKAASVDDEYLQKAEKYLYEELAVSLGMSFEDAKSYFLEEVHKVSA